MRITRLTLVGLLVLSAGVLLLFEAMSAGAAQSKRFHYTHRVSVVGHLVDHWTINDTGYCGLVGDGTVTVDYQTTKPSLARPYIDRYAGLHGTWVLGVPVGGGIGGMPPKPAIGTITRVDNTTQTPPPTGDCGDPPDKSGCGTAPLVKPQSVVEGFDTRRLLADLSSEEFGYQHGHEVACHVGELSNFSSSPSLAGGTRKGELLLKMPRARVLRRRLVRVTGSSHKHSAFTEGDVTLTEDVTRTVTVTFKRLER